MKCKYCGCTDVQACEGGCWWSAPEVCSTCAHQPFQHRVSRWMAATFGAAIAADTIERNHRFLEEAVELVQACGTTASEAHQLVDYVFNRPVGEPYQEVGGVMVTLAALCDANALDMRANGESELARVWVNIDQIRAKQAAKPKHSPLPAAVSGVCTCPSGDEAQALRFLLDSDAIATAGGNAVLSPVERGAVAKAIEVLLKGQPACKEARDHANPLPPS